MQVFTDPGLAGAEHARGQTVRELRIELAARGDHTTGSMLYVNEKGDGTLLVTVARGHGRLEHHGSGRRGRELVGVLVVEATTVPEPEVAPHA